MAPAVQADVPFHRSHSTPDLLSGLPNHPSTVSISSPLSPSQLKHRTLSLKSLPSLPAFDVPSLDFDFEFDDDDFKTSLHLDTNPVTDNLRPAAANDKDVASARTAPTTLTQGAIPAKPGKTRGKKSMIDRRRWLPSSKSSPDVRIFDDEVPATPKIPNAAPIREKEAAPEPKALERSRTMESLAGLARRSWISSGSRSPWPSPKKGSKDASRQRTSGNGKKARSETGAAAVSSGSPIDSRPPGLVDDPTQPAESPSSKGRALNRASVYFTKFSKRPQSFVKSASSLSLSASSSSTSKIGGADNNDTAPSAPTAATATPSSLSTDTLTISNNNICSLNHRNSSQTTSSSTTDTTGCVSENASSQATADTGLTMPHPTSRDPLWATFRKLDSDYAAFAAKNSTAAKMAAVRTTLLPFLGNTAGHPSNCNRAVLTPEDVDRRATILNKWWNGLLEMLDSGSQSVMAGMRVHSNLAFSTTNHMNNLQPVAGVDRPTLLEATTMIMMRPEWRLSTTYFQPLAERSPAEIVRQRSGTQSTRDTDDQSAWALSGGGAEMMVESAEHNIRTMFTTNLTTQMALVVDKMSMRHAPTSLVNWSGKACAYAFFFTPGIADILVRLWGLRADLVRRVADEFCLPRRSRGESEDIVALFPPNLGGLGWTSVKTITDRLRLAAKLPLLASKIQWHGPWVSRWRGGDTDLLFIFCKYYYILAEEFMPGDLPLVEKARGPAFVLLHAQLLANLDSSIQRQGPLDALSGPPLTDGIYGADASMSALSLPPYNLMKGMAENRLVILLKDMLADNTVGVLPSVKLTFAEAFMAVTRSATKRTSRYEHTSIFMLCDYLEEVLTTYNYYQNTLNSSYATSPREEAFPLFDPSVSPGPAKQIDFIDWPFWFDVCRMMLDSNNTMAEIRVLSFVYMLWDAIVADPSRKKALVIDWLLSDVTFDKFFNNWCPMVRAYYMRLLCWRICRDSGSANEVDEQIFLLAAQRLKTVWAHYLWMKQNADEGKSLPTSTAPCYPTPGKRFMIIRTEVQTPQPGLFVGFDQFPTSLSGGGTEGVPYTGPAAVAADASSRPADTASKKKWSLIGKVLSMTAGAAAGVNMAGGNLKRTWDNDELEQVRKETAASRTRGPPPPPKQSSTGVTSSSESTSSTGSAPIFDEIQYQFRFTLTWQNHATTAAGPPRDRVLTRPRLPALAQARVSARLATLQANNPGSGETAMGRSDTPPPPAPGLPPATRRISGVMQPSGLVTEARNARPLETDSPLTPTRPGRPVEYSSPEQSISFSETPNLDLTALPIRPSRTSTSTSHPSSPRASEDLQTPRTGTPDPSPSTQPLRPAGMYISNATYAGRALAEWAMVVAECNNFVERRRDEGVLGLGEVEVPSLGVDGLGMRAFGGRA
ncbi:DUF1765-domain-containing protein [Coniochaeta sp. PMI_546]|nr:DUF1765-domain-containing protein [Coniochaeta sp. PMI_546]